MVTVLQIMSHINRNELKNYTFEFSKDNIIKNQSNIAEFIELEPIVKLIYRIYII